MYQPDIMEVEPAESDSQDPAAILRRVEADIRRVSKEIEVMQTKKARLISKRDKIKESIQQEKNAELSNRDWDRKDFSFSQVLQEKLTSVFGIQNLRAHQLPTMNATLSGIDCILIMPTGGGKSLCYQLPALVSKGVTLVVSPLLALMEDQLMGLKKYDVSAYMFTSKTTAAEAKLIHTSMVDPKAPMKLLYVTPEKLAKSKRFMTYLQKMYTAGRFARLAIDEVHCCSQWGHDFRPDYKFLGIMRTQFPKTPIIGLTATATARVIKDVQKILNIPESLILKASFNRPNLYYQVRPKPSSHEEFVDDLAKLLTNDFRGQSGIIYTMTIKDAEKLSTDLRQKGVKVRQYHAMLEPEHRTIVHQKWVKNELQAVVATIAFGMGIDKPDVRFVIHHCISKSMENFYQESGRAGRDDKPAKCIVYWRLADLFRQSTMVFTEQTGLENLYGMITYCADQLRCRRNIIAEHFQETWESTDCNAMCDHCKVPRVAKTMDISKHAENLLALIAKATSADKRLTGPKLIELWFGKGEGKFRIKESEAKGISQEMAETLVAFLLLDGYLKEDFHFTPYSTISYIVPGPKAEAGIPPSSMEVSGMRKEAISNTNGKTSSNSNTEQKNISVKDTSGKHKSKSSDKKRLHSSESNEKIGASSVKNKKVKVDDSEVCDFNLESSSDEEVDTNKAKRKSIVILESSEED